MEVQSHWNTVHARSTGCYLSAAVKDSVTTESLRLDCFCCQWDGYASQTSVIPRSHVGKESQFSRHVSQTDEWALCQSTSPSLADLYYYSCPLCHSHTHIIHLRKSLLSNPALLSPIQTTTEAWFNKKLSNRHFLCFMYYTVCVFIYFREFQSNLHWYKIGKI